MQAHLAPLSIRSPTHSRLDERAQHVLHDATMPVVIGFTRSIDANLCHEGLTVGNDANLRGCGSRIERRDPRYGESLSSGDAQRCRSISLVELQWENAHADEVGAVNALERLSNYCTNSKQSS